MVWREVPCSVVIFLIRYCKWNGNRLAWHLKPKELSYWMVILFKLTNIFIWSRFQTSSGLNKI